MSEYQYYEFQAIDRPLGPKEQAALRAISTRARITSTSFTNTYEWGDLKANPLNLLARYFDVFLYLANWNTRRLALRLPSRLVDMAELRSYAISDELVTIERHGEHVLVDISVDEVETEDWEDGSGRLAGLAPLRAALLEDDHSLFLLLWLIGVERRWVADNAQAPIACPDHLPVAIAALGDFLGVDTDLIAVAFSQSKPGVPESSGSPERDIETAIRALSEVERMSFLIRLHQGNDPHLGAELRRRCADAGGDRSEPRTDGRWLTAGKLRLAAGQVAEARKRHQADQAAAEQRRRAVAEAAERKRRLNALSSRGEAAWHDVDDLIELRNAPAYDKATALLLDLAAIADTSGRRADFERNLEGLAKRHERKGQLIRRLVATGLVFQR
jgi:hypothetical protein